MVVSKRSVGRWDGCVSVNPKEVLLHGMVFEMVVNKLEEPLLKEVEVVALSRVREKIADDSESEFETKQRLARTRGLHQNEQKKKHLHAH